MNRVVFSVTLSAAALLAAGASAAVQSSALVTRFQEEIAEAAGAGQGAGAFQVLAAQAGIAHIREGATATAFMSEDEVEAAAVSLALDISGNAENAFDIAESLIATSAEIDFAPVERIDIDFREESPSEALVAQTPVPAAFAVMLAGLAGLGGVVLRRTRRGDRAV